MHTRADSPTLLEIAYEAGDQVDCDVDTFESFYRRHFEKDALSRLERREGSRYKAYALALCFGSLLCAIPMVINPTSIFAVILLFMGGMVLVAGLYYVHRAVAVETYCTRHFEKLMMNEFAASRSTARRVFDIRCMEQVVAVRFRLSTAGKKEQVRSYEKISGVYLTDELLFIQGLTWVTRFRMGDEDFENLCAVLREKCSDRFHDWQSR